MNEMDLMPNRSLAIYSPHLSENDNIKAIYIFMDEVELLKRHH